MAGSVQNERIIVSGFNQPVVLGFPEINRKSTNILLKSPLCTNANMILGDPISLLAESEISTNGWDTISVSRVSALNVKIESEKSYPDHISQKSEDDVVDLDGFFNPWRVISGGGGKNVKLSVPMKSGVYNGLSKKNIDLVGVTFYILVTLSYFPIPAPTVEDDKYDLKVRTVSSGVGDQIVAVTGFDAPEGRLSDLEGGILCSLMSLWLNAPENLQKFTTLFSTVLINNAGVASDEYKWLRSTAISYAYADMGTDESSLFGVLCMTNQRSAVGIPNQLPIVNLVCDDNAALIISRQIYVKYHLFPSLSKVFPGSKQSNFILSDDLLTITGRDIQLDSVILDGETYNPVAKTLSITLNSACISMTAEIRTDIALGVYTTTTVSAMQRLKLQKNSKGEQVLVYENINDPVISNFTHISKWVDVTAALLGIVTGVLYVVAALTGGLAAVVIITVAAFFVLMTVTAAVYPMIQRAKAEGMLEHVPSITPMAHFAANQVRWPFSEANGFSLSDVRYCGEIIFYGKLKLTANYAMINNKLTYIGDGQGC